MRLLNKAEITHVNGAGVVSVLLVSTSIGLLGWAFTQHPDLMYQVLAYIPTESITAADSIKDFLTVSPLTQWVTGCMLFGGIIYLASRC